MPKVNHIKNNNSFNIKVKRRPNKKLTYRDDKSDAGKWYASNILPFNKDNKAVLVITLKVTWL